MCMALSRMPVAMKLDAQHAQSTPMPVAAWTNACELCMLAARCGLAPLISKRWGIPCCASRLHRQVATMAFSMGPDTLRCAIIR